MAAGFAIVPSGFSAWEGLFVGWWLRGAGVVLLVLVGALVGVDRPVAAGAGDGGVVVAGGFSDVGGGVHQAGIEALEGEGVFEGTECGEGLFCAGDSIRRWVMAVWLVRVLDGSDPAAGSGSSRFVDVDAGAWWAPFVDRLAELGVTAGCSTGPLRFCPDEAVTRGQMATFLVRAFGLETEVPTAGFVDVDGVHAANIDAVAAVRITAGCHTTPLRYCPRRATTRGQIATFLARALGLVEIPEPDAGSDAPFVAVDGTWDYACGLRSDGTLDCWGMGAYSTEDKFTRFDLASQLSVGCGVRTDRTVVCWPDADGFPWPSGTVPPAGEYSDVAVTWANHGTFACGLRTDQTLACWGGSSGNRDSSTGKVGFPERPPGTFIDVAADNGRFCAVRTDQTITCWGTHDKMETWDVPAGQYTAVDVGGLHACGLLDDQTIKLLGQNRLCQLTCERLETKREVHQG